MISDTPVIRLVFFTDILIEDFDGASRTMFQLIRRIPPAKFKVLFICGTGPEQLFGFEVIRLPAMRLPVNRDYKIALPWLSKEKIRRKMDAFRPQIIHIATPSLLGQFALQYAQKHQVPVVTMYHTHFISYIDYYLRYAPFLIQLVRARASRAHRTFYNGCNKVYIPSETIAAELINMGVEAEKCSIWKRGIDTTQFTPAKRDIAYIRSLTGNWKPNILFVSRLVWEKNLQTLIHIYKIAERQGSPYNFIIAGDGIAAKACKEEMKNAFFMGKLSHEALSRLYASSDIFLFPSVSETFGNVVAEAMASGLPCVIANGGGSRDFVEDGINGFVSQPFHTLEYIQKIESILSNHSLRSAMSQAAVHSTRLLNWDQLVQRYLTDLVVLVTQYQQPMHQQSLLPARS